MGELSPLRLTEMQADYVRYLISGKSPEDAVIAAGYTADAYATAYRLSRTPAVTAVMRSEINRLLVVEGLPLAYQTLLQLAKDSSVNPAVRRACARDLMDRAGIVPPKASAADPGGQKPLSEMSSDELRGLVDRLESELAGRAIDVSAQVSTPALPNRLEFLG